MDGLHSVDVDIQRRRNVCIFSGDELQDFIQHDGSETRIASGELKVGSVLSWSQNTNMRTTPAGAKPKKVLSGSYERCSYLSLGSAVRSR